MTRDTTAGLDINAEMCGGCEVIPMALPAQSQYISDDTPFDPDAMSIKFTRLLKERIGVSMAIPLHVVERARFDVEIDHITESMLVHLNTWLLRGEDTQKATGAYQTPASWWDHFKVTYFSHAMLRVFPAKYATHTYTYTEHIHVCPHADVAWPDRRHIDFMEMRRTVGRTTSAS